jgi:hypothetical protein
MKLAVLLVALFALPGEVFAQHSPDAITWAKPIKDPVTSAFKGLLRRYQENLVEAAEQMPREKYGFRPTPQLRSFAGLLTRVVDSNSDLCSVAGGVSAPKSKKLNDTDSKEELIKSLRGSFDFCETAFVKVHDWQLREVVYFTREMMSERAMALSTMIEVWAAQYKAAGIYLRMNGLEPPIYGRDQ